MPEPSAASKLTARKLLEQSLFQPLQRSSRAGGEKPLIAANLAVAIRLRQNSQVERALAYQQIGVEAVLQGAKAEGAHVVSQLHNAGVVDAPKVQYL